MEIYFGYQYFNFDLEEITKEKTPIDYNRAVELFNSFPWEDQFKSVLKNKEAGLSSTYPTLYFFETEDKFISISAINNEGFSVSYINNNRQGDLFITNNVLENPENISVEQIIEDFFSGEIDGDLNIFEFELEQIKEVKYELAYKKSNLYKPLLYLLFPFVFIFLNNKDLATVLPIILFMSVLILFFILPNLALNFSYWNNDWDQTIIYNPIKKLITFKKKNEIIQFQKSKIDLVELIRPRTYQRAFLEYSYLRIKSGDLRFIVTHLTVDPTELISILKINFKEIEVFYPSLNLDKESEKEKQRKQTRFENKRKEFLSTYSNWETKKLEEVVDNTDQYADYAISAAIEILKKRKDY